MSNLKVIVCAFNPERQKRTTSKYPDHNQDISTYKEHCDMWQNLIDTELAQDAGCPLDILIVLNGSCGGFWGKYDGLKTKNGKIIVKQRKNIGGAFGGYSYAYENFHYDTYIFTEDDLFILGDGYYQKCLDMMGDLGFLALIGISDNPAYPKHAHGGVGLVKREVLDGIANDKGQLPFYDGEWRKSYVIFFGEIALTQKMLDKGFKVDYLGKKKWSRDNFLLPYYEISHR